MIGPDGVDAHGAPTLVVNVVEGDGGAVVERLLLGCAFTFGRVIGRDEVGAGGAAHMAQRAVFLDKLKEDDAFVQGFFQIIGIHNQSLSTNGS